MILKDFLLEAGLPENYKFKTDGGAYYISDVKTFKGWYVWKVKNNHTYLRLHRWHDAKDFFFSTDEGTEKYKEDPKVTAILMKQKLSDQRASCARYIEEWQKLKISNESKYVTKKGVTPSMHIKLAYDTNGGSSVFIPAYSDWGFTGYQQITDDGFKVFCAGQRVEGTYCILGHSSDLSGVALGKSVPVLVCEGWATGETVRALWTKVRGECLVVVAWNAGNLGPVARAVRKAFPGNPLVVVADNDCWKEQNTGLRAAEEVADLVSATVLAPFFSEDMSEKRPTDWNDLWLLSASTSEAQISSHKIQKPPQVHCLGYYQSDFFLSSSQNPQILAVSEPSDTQLLKLLPLKYWALHYPKLSTSGAPQGVDWLLAKSDILEKCCAAGLFDRASLRGRGFWKHEGRIILNTGSKMWDQGKWCEVRDYGPSYVYTQNIELNPVPVLKDNTHFLTNLSHLRFDREMDKYFLLGWLVAAPLAGVTEWRPHIWITGEKGSGKSTILEYVIRPMFEAWTTVRADKSSEAGIRQTIKNDAVPVIMDEFEPGKHSGPILNLLRVASSESGPIRRGTPSGKSLEFTARFNACMSSIHTAQLDPADESRIEMLYLRKAQDSGWNFVKEKLSQSFNRERSLELMSWLMQGGAELVIGAQERLRASLEGRMDARSAQHYGALVGAASAFLNLAAKDEEALLDKVVVSRDLVRETEGEDYKDCLTAILSCSVRTSLGDSTISDLVASDLNKDLSVYGIKKMQDGKLAIWLNSEELRKKLPEKYKGYANALSKIEGAEKRTVKISGVVKKCLVLDAGVEEDERVP